MDPWVYAWATHTQEPSEGAVVGSGSSKMKNILWKSKHVKSGASLYITYRKDRQPLLVLMEGQTNILTATVSHFGDHPKLHSPPQPPTKDYNSPSMGGVHCTKLRTGHYANHTQTQ